MSQDGSSKCNSSRTASRTLRLSRFRTTALPMARGTVNPILDAPGSGRRRQNAAKYGVDTRNPLS